MKGIINRKGLFYLFIAIGIIIFPFCSGSVDNQLKKIVEDTNKATPRLLDQWTRLDSCKALPGKNIRHFHTVSDIVISDTTLFKSNLKPQVVSVIKTSPDMKFFRENGGVTMQYQYNDQSGKYIFSLVITPEDYKN